MSRVLDGSISAGTEFIFPYTITLERGGVYLLIASVGSISAGSVTELSILINGSFVRVFRGANNGSVVMDFSGNTENVTFSVKILCSQNVTAVRDERFNFLQAVRLK